MRLHRALFVLLFAVQLWQIGHAGAPEGDRLAKLEKDYAELVRKVAEQEKRIARLEGEKAALGTSSGAFTPEAVGSNAEGVEGCAAGLSDLVKKEEHAATGRYYTDVALNNSNAECNRLYVVTYTTEAVNKLFCFMAASAASQGLKLNVLALQRQAKFKENDKLDKIWVASTLLPYALATQSPALHEFVESLPADECSVVLFTDAFDVLFTQGPTRILKRFFKSGRKVLFSSERGCSATKEGMSQRKNYCEPNWPEPDVATPSPFLNSGAFIGYRKELQRLLKVAKREVEVTRLWAVQNKVFFPYHGDDQMAFSHIMANNRKIATDIGMGLDYQNQLFLCTYNVPLPDGVRFTQSGRVVAADTTCEHLRRFGPSQEHLFKKCESGNGCEVCGTGQPSVLHFNGPHKEEWMKLIASRVQWPEIEADVTFWDEDGNRRVALEDICVQFGGGPCPGGLAACLGS